MNEAGNNMNICTEAVPSGLCADISAQIAANPDWPVEKKRAAYFAKYTLALLDVPCNWKPVPAALNRATMSASLDALGRA